MSFFEILQTIFIGPLKLIFEYIFYFACKIVYHPGLAIIMLSLAMNILVLPLYRRADAMQEASRDVEAKLAPGASHIKKAFSGDERMMILQTYYRQNHYKPTDALKGSVSLLLEVPFFMAAYQFLSSAPELEQYSFGPIANLGAPDGLLVIGGVAINLLPVLMTLINVISSAIYLKGFPLKTKIQLYAMAAFFLVFLYNSPSGLVFYWTLNNLFSLVKTIFYKLKNPKKVLMGLMLLAGIGILVFGKFFYAGTAKRQLFVTLAGIAITAIPVVIAIFSRLPFQKAVPRTNKKLFTLGCLFLTVLVGLLIPSTVISASPLEFVDATDFYNPLLYVLHTACMAAGTFLVWLQVFYWLANDTGKAVFEKLVWILCGVMLVNYMFFGTELGILSANLQYEAGVSFTAKAKLFNLAVLGAIALVFLLVSFKWSKIIISVLLIASIALGGMSALNMISAGRALNTYKQSASFTAEKEDPHFTLSKTEENVVVIMLDRALAQAVPYIFEEKPELKAQFDGFTFYDNTISYGTNTNFSSPALLGGYEYTPVELNRRSEESLQEKHNEALKMMPVLFDQEGFDVTVLDPVYANYQWIPDLSIYKEYPDIDAYITEGAFTPNQTGQTLEQTRSRNFFCFSIMKTMPLVLQPIIYGYGSYNQLGTNSIQMQYDMSTAEGFPSTFLDRYMALDNMTEMTNLTDNGEGSFLLMTNNTPHDAYLLQTPDYVPMLNVDNREYDAVHADRFTLDSGSITVETPFQMAYYHVNMATMLKMGEWFDDLRQMGVYDNTRIILVADHGGYMAYDADFYKAGHDLGSLYPMLMVKDFNTTGFTTCSDFMTLADVPTLAVRGVVEDPVNPFTGIPITDAEKTAHDQFVTLSGLWDVTVNNGNTFLPSAWASVHTDMRNIDNWTFYAEEDFVLSEHSAP